MSINNKVESLTPQTLYNQFEQEMKKKDKSCIFQYLLNNCIKLQTVRYFLLLIFIGILPLSIEDSSTRKVIQVLIKILFPILILLIINKYFEHKKNSDKIKANEIIKNILEKEKIIINEENLEQIIKHSGEIGSKEKKEWELVKKSKIIFLLQKLVTFNIGIAIGFLGNEIIKEGIYRFNENLKSIFDISFLIILIIIYCSDVIYLIERSNSYYYDLYIEILKDKKFVFSLKR